MLDTTKKIDRQFLSAERLAFSSKYCVFNNLLGVKELILQLPQFLSDYIWTLINCSLGIGTFEKRRRNRRKTFLFRKITFF